MITTTATEEIFKDRLVELIPNFKFRSFDFDKETLKFECLTKIYDDLPKFEAYADALENLIYQATDGKLPKNNYLISAPNGFGKKYAIYNMIRCFHKFGYKPTGILSLRDLTQEGVDLKALFDNDIIYIYIDTLDVQPDFYHYLLNMSDTTATPIMFISRFGVTEIIKESEDFENIFDDNAEDYDFSYIKTIKGE